MGSDPLPTPADSVRSAADWLFWAAVCLASVLVILKAGYLVVHGSFRGPGFLSDLRSLAAISNADLVFVTTLWVCGRALLAVGGSRFWAARAILIVWIACAAGVCLYAVASVIAFGALGGFLTYALLHQVGNVRMLSSSVTAYLTFGVVFTLVSLPLAYVALVVGTVRRAARGRSRRWLRSAIACGTLVVWIAVGHHAYASDWVTHYDWRIADNAPWVLAVSWWQASNAERPVRLADTFSAGDLTDFEPIGQRTPRAAAPTSRPSRAVRSAPPSRTAGGRPLNVLVIVLESVAERWTSFGGIYDTTPNLVKESGRGLVVDHFYAHVGRSSNSLAALLLSVYPKLNFRDFTEEYPRVERTSLASMFHDRGYRTAFMTPSDMSWAGWGTFLPARGFDEVRDQHALACSPPISSWGVEDRCLADGLVEFIKRDPARPFFAMGWTQQTHHPYEPSPDVAVVDLVGDREPSPDAYDLNRYLNVLRETDNQLEHVFEALRAAGIADDTLVAVVGDHGQAFGYPHDSYLQGRTVYEEDVQVPLLVWWPRRYRAAQRAPIIGGHVDLAPTIAELAGMPPAPDWQGRSLFDQQRAPRAYFYVAQDEFKLAIREGNWKYILDLRAGTDELYDLERDPSEQRNMASAQPDRCARLRQRLAAWAEANRRQYDRP
jgi:phosphoglycerol transferase MdoB-like AlkP superfamily enzyme